MFGYIVANSKILAEQDKQRYKACYCGLCRALKERHGQIGRMTLTYDMTFLILVLTSLYEPQECTGCERCLVHPAKKHGFASSEITDYAADMNVALAYLNQMDNWKDDKNLLSLVFAKLLKKRYGRISLQYPRQCGAMESCLKQLSDFEKSGEQNPDIAAGIFGRLMGELFVLREDGRWSPTLRSMGEYLGEFIYIMDAVLDLEGDIRRGRYNPLISSRDAGLGDEYFREVLTILIGNCCMQFDILPLVDDVGIMRNILCSGVWTKYELQMAKKAKRNAAG